MASFPRQHTATSFTIGKLATITCFWLFNLWSKKYVAQLCASFNAAACCVDRIWDVEHEYLSIIQSRLTVSNLEYALTNSSFNVPIFSAGFSQSTPVLLRLSCMLVDIFTSDLYPILNSMLIGKSFRKSYLSSITMLLRTYLCSSKLSIEHAMPTSTLSAILQEIGSGPFRIMAQISLLTKEPCNVADWTRFSQESLIVGDIFRWIDDLVDIVEDFSLRQCNSVWLLFAERGGRIMTEDRQLRQLDELLPELVESGVIESVVSQIIQNWIFLDRPKEVSRWIHAWLS
jgi:hypothetical protein